MKKLIFSLLLFLMLPIITMASEVNYIINGYYIDVNILENGDAEVSEIFMVDGSLNGYEMNLFYTSSKSSLRASDISNIKVSGLEATAISFNTFAEEFTEYNLVTSASAGDDFKYTVDTVMDGYRIRMYHPTDNEKYVFRLDYTIEDIVTEHRGFAEFYWNFFSGNLSDTIKDLNVRITLPGLDDSDYFRFGLMVRYLEK